ncbi:MAG: hypothetical protein JNM68_12510 [Dinghuibacter sp.]|nr:hypothetical protein [Dinghuibacter sp.]
MKNALFALLLLGGLLTACSKENALPEEQPQIQNRNPLDERGTDEPFCTTATVNLIAGQHINAGNIEILQDEQFIYVTYNTTDGWVLAKTHLYVGGCAAIPVNGAGNPQPGRFPYKAAHSNVTSYTYAVPIAAIGIGNCGCIAAHAEVKKLNASGSVIQQETAWGEGSAINPSGSWAMKFEFCPVACP